MDKKAYNFNHPNSADMEKSFTRMNLSDVFKDKHDIYLNEFNLFTATYNYIPNFIHEIGIDCTKANAWFAETFKDEIKDHYFSKLYRDDSKKADLDSIFYFLF